MQLGKLGEQFVLKSEKAFNTIKFLDYTVCDNTVYYAKRKARDNEARAVYHKEMESEDINGIYCLLYTSFVIVNVNPGLNVFLINV